MEKDLGPEGMAKSVIVVSTSDQPAPMRIRASILATSLAEGFRNEGKKSSSPDGFFNSVCYGSKRDWVSLW